MNAHAKDFIQVRADRLEPGMWTTGRTGWLPPRSFLVLSCTLVEMEDNTFGMRTIHKRRRIVVFNSITNQIIVWHDERDREYNVLVSSVNAHAHAGVKGAGRASKTPLKEKRSKRV